MLIVDPEAAVRSMFSHLKKKWEDMPISPRASLEPSLRKLRKPWLDAISANLGLKKTKKDEAARAICARLEDAVFLRGLVDKLPAELQEALRFVLQEGGWVTKQRFTRRFGSDKDDHPFWDEVPPTSALGGLRAHGLVLTGYHTLDGRRSAIVVVPAELRERLAEWASAGPAEKRAAPAPSKAAADTGRPVPHPGTMEREMRKIGKLLDGRGFDSVQQANAFLQQTLTSGWEPPPSEDPREQAQELIYQAWEISDPRKVRRLAQRALELWPDCADAHVLFGDRARTVPAAIPHYEQGVRAGERALGPEVFAEGTGRFWGIDETRPYMRARARLAQALWQVGQREDAIQHAEELLRLNTNDNQGIRYNLLHWYLEQRRTAEAGRLLAAFTEEFAFWLYGRALLLFQTQGATDLSRHMLKKAVHENPYVGLYVVNPDSDIFPEETPPSYSPGSPEEAVIYAKDYLNAWIQTEGALRWFMTELPDILKELREGKVAGGPKVGRNDPCPCGSGRKYKKCCMEKVEG